MTIRVSSPVFEAGGAIPTKYTGEGEDVSPPLELADLPEGTREIALVCDDPDAPTPEPFVHWVLYRIHPDITSLDEGRAPQGSLGGTNDFGGTGYGGPMPPRSHGIHHYRFKVYALDAELDAAEGLTRNKLLGAMEGNILDEGELVGTYQRA